MLVQGRLAPLETHIKQDRRGIGAETNNKKRVIASLKGSEDQHGLSKKQGETEKEEKGLSKKARKARARAQQEQEQAFARDFFREFWPENV
jgi:peptidoglycan hydrolase CwlO-like protein